MRHGILLYGATGYSGRLIAAEAKERGMSRSGRDPCRMILAARDIRTLHDIAREYDMEYRAFGLDSDDDLARGLDGVDVVLNAAGPFALTAERLMKAALKAGCHYVDINGEVDVYMRLDDFGRKAFQLGRALVSGAGATAAASDILLNAALEKLQSSGVIKHRDELGSIRIAVSRDAILSRGSLLTAARLIKEQVIVVRKGFRKIPGHGLKADLVRYHEPIGKLEYLFDFSDRKSENECRPRIASAANLIDTLAAQRTMRRRELSVRTIESYLEMEGMFRLAYQAGGLLAPFGQLPQIRALLESQLYLLPEGPDSADRRQKRHSLVLLIEDRFRTRLVDWRWETPNVYDFTARLAVWVSGEVAKGKPAGWMTPAEVLKVKPETLDLPDENRPPALRECILQGNDV